MIDFPLDPIPEWVIPSEWECPACAKRGTKRVSYCHASYYLHRWKEDGGLYWSCGSIPAPDQEDSMSELVRPIQYFQRRELNYRCDVCGCHETRMARPESKR